MRKHKKPIFPACATIAVRMLSGIVSGDDIDLPGNAFPAFPATGIACLMVYQIEKAGKKERSAHAALSRMYIAVGLAAAYVFY